MAGSGGRSRRRWIPVVAVAAAMAAAACGDGSGGASGDDELDPADWIAVELSQRPDHFEIAGVRESSSTGRQIAYGVGGDVEADLDSQISLTARVPIEWTVDELLAASRSSPDSGATEIEGEVAGHRAVVRPVTSDGRTQGWEAVWEPTPGLQVRLVDSRTIARGGLDASGGSVTALAEQVRGLDRKAWTDIRNAHGGPWSSSAAPPGAVEREVADGVLDARQWTLSVLGPTDEDEGVGYCFRLSYAGEDTGRGCSVERVVLAGKGFVLGWVGGGDDPGELVAGPGSSFDPIMPAMHTFGRDSEGHVSIAVLPDEACGVIRIGRAGLIPTPLGLLPGDEGAVECSTR